MTTRCFAGLKTAGKILRQLKLKGRLTFLCALLALTGRLASEARAEAGSPATAKPLVHARPIRVALYKGPGTGGKGPPELMEKLGATNAPTTVTEITPAEIQAGALTNFDVVIFGGGSGSKEGAAIGEAGRAQVENFIGNGGGYVGICAGAYLATSGYPWSLHVINARTLSPKWERGRAILKMEITSAGEAIIGGPTNLEVMYHQGPVVGPARVSDLPPYQTLVWFRTEVASNNTPAGIMINSPAIFAGQYKQGRVVCISPHPEQTEGLDYIVPQAVNWAAPATASMQ